MYADQFPRSKGQINGNFQDSSVSAPSSRANPAVLGDGGAPTLKQLLTEAGVEARAAERTLFGSVLCTADAQREAAAVAVGHLQNAIDLLAKEPSCPQ